MLGVIKAELRKMRRLSLLLPLGGILALLSAGITTIVFIKGKTNSETLSKFDGAYFTFSTMGLFLSLISLSLFASQSSNEYSYGTLRNLLVRQPLRLKLLSGKLIAMAIFTFALITFVAFINITLSFSESGLAHANTHLWLSGKAISTFLTTFGNMLVATIGYGLFGMALGLILKSPMSAISISLLWFMVLENILGSTLPESAKWLPGNALAAVSNGGVKTYSYERGLLMSGVFLLIFGGYSTFLFMRRDVSS
jgi:ABC-type transport system involved in multi-copper enzyme maturation permease subunit